MTRRQSFRMILGLALFASLAILAGARFQALGASAGRNTHGDVASTSLPSLTGYVDPFVGTAGQGYTFPGASLPHGMVQWSPETTAGGLYRPGGYNSGDLIIRGFGLTHLSGAGCVAFANVPIMPTVRAITTAPQPNGSPYSDRFVTRSEQATPGYYAVRLASGIGVRLTVTARSGFASLTFPAVRRATIVLDAGNGAEGKTNIDGAIASSVEIHGRDTITGWVRAGHFCGLGNTFTLFFAARFDRPFAAAGTWRNTTLTPKRLSAGGPRAGAYVQFDTRRKQNVQMKVGLSYVSVAGAERNLAAESPSWNFAAVHAAATRHWNLLLNRIQLAGGTLPQRRTFYTALYHSLLAPTLFSDVDGAYPGFDGRMHRARGYEQYANFSGWDIYRSQIPLLAWLEPAETGDMMQSLVADAQQGGWLPKWPVANGYTGEMDGDSADPILAGAAAFGATGFDRRAALRAMVKGASIPGTGPGGYVERPQLSDYLRRGYAIPVSGGWGAAAETLEYATDDHAIARMASMLGERAAAARFSLQSQRWRALFNQATHFIEPRDGGGRFPTRFDPFSTDGFVEGDAWQYLWMVPADLPTIAHLLGGPGQAVARLDQHFGKLNAGPTSRYYWAGNEPGLATPWAYDFFGRPDRTIAVVRRIMDGLYSDARAGLPGNDDLGALSSWYVWAALGLYPEIPGDAGLALAAPLFPRVTLHYGSGRRLRLVARDATARLHGQPLVFLDGKRLGNSWLALSRLRTDSTLTFEGATSHR